jgi:hypothetical protein
VNDYCTALTRHLFFSYYYKYTFCFTKQWHYLFYPEQTLWVIIGLKVGISLTGLTLPPWCACPMFASGLPTSFVSWSFCVQWFEVRCGCLLCWYWWNCWPSLYDFLFFNDLELSNFYFCPFRVKYLMEKQHISMLSLWSDRRTRYLISF